jgi:hypothetical protein
VVVLAPVSLAGVHSGTVVLVPMLGPEEQVLGCVRRRIVPLGGVLVDVWVGPVVLGALVVIGVDSAGCSVRWVSLRRVAGLGAFARIGTCP